MGIVVKKIGTAGTDRHYSTIQAWEDALPASLTTDGNEQIGELYADSEFVAAQPLTMGGVTTDAVNKITLRAAAGQSFRDHATAATNRYAYDATKGVALRCTGSYTSGILTNGIANVRFEGLQVKAIVQPSRGIKANGNNSIIDGCIFYARPGNGVGDYIVDIEGIGSKIINSLLVIDSANTATGIRLFSPAEAYNCTIVRPSNYAASGAAATTTYGACTVKNCAFFGFPDTPTGTFNADGHNVTSAATAPASTANLTGKVYANQFVQTSTAGAVEDFRVKAGADLIGAGARDAANTADLDALKLARSTTTPTVGAIEYIDAGGGGAGISGSFAATESVDVLAAAGALGLAPITGTLARTEGADTLAAAGSLGLIPLSGTFAAAEAPDTLIAAGTAAFSGVGGTLASTEAPDTASAAGTVTWSPITGLFAATEGPDRLSASGTAALPAITGTLAATEGADTLVASNVAAAPQGGGGGGGSVREVRAFAERLSQPEKRSRSEKRKRRRQLATEALELLPDLPPLDAAAIARAVFEQEARALAWTPFRAMQPLAFNAEDALRERIAAWLQQIEHQKLIDDEHDLELLLLG